MLGNKVTISQYAYLCTASHDISILEKPLTAKPITIESYAWVCARAFITPGVNIGQGAVVAACGVVLKDIERWKVVGGNPAKVMKDRVISEKGPDDGKSGSDSNHSNP